MHLHSANAQQLQEREWAHNPKQCIAFTMGGGGGERCPVMFLHRIKPLMFEGA